jgi:hypothetical protein
MMTQTESSGEARFKAMDIVLAAVCLLAAGLVLFSRLSHEDGADLNGERQLDTPESAAVYVCPDDGATLSVTPFVFEQMLACGRAGPLEGAAPRSRGVYLRCPECGKRVMAQGIRCPVDGTTFARFDDHGQPCVCPSCLAAGLARSGDDQTPIAEAG